MSNNKTPNLEKVQQFLNETPEDSFLLDKLKRTQENMDIIKQIFLNNESYLPLLKKACEKGNPTFNTLTTQIKQLCDIQPPDTKFKPRRSGRS